MTTKVLPWKDEQEELCYCGHLRSQHKDTLAVGHGACTKCACRKFTWKAFVNKLEGQG